VLQGGNGSQKGRMIERKRGCTRRNQKKKKTTKKKNNHKHHLTLRSEKRGPQKKEGTFQRSASKDCPRPSGGVPIESEELSKDRGEGRDEW